MAGSGGNGQGSHSTTISRRHGGRARGSSGADSSSGGGNVSSSGGGNVSSSGDSSGSSSGDGSGAGHGSRRSSRPGPRTHTADQQPQLHAWLQQEQGLLPGEADSYARRFALVFGSQQAALMGLPATFDWCRSQGLSGLQTAEVLDRIAGKRPQNVINFASTAQHDWQLIDGCISVCVQQRQHAGARLPKHTSLAGVLCSWHDAARALGMPPGHVGGWLGAVGHHLPAADIGAMLARSPLVLTGRPATALAAIDWAAEVLRPASMARFLRGAPHLLTNNAATLQAKLDNLQQAAGFTAEQARQLVLKQPRLLQAQAETVQQAAAWLRQYFPVSQQLQAVVQRGPHLLTSSADSLQSNAAYLQQRLGWSKKQVAAHIEAYPQPFGDVDLSSPEAQAKLLFLTQVVGVDAGDCIGRYSAYLVRSLGTMGARYMLVQVGGWQLGLCFAASGGCRSTQQAGGADKQLKRCYCEHEAFGHAAMQGTTHEHFDSATCACAGAGAVHAAQR